MNSALSDLEVFQISPKFFQRCSASGIERAMIRPGTEENQRASVQTKRRNSIANALFRFGRDRTDSPAQLLQRDALLSIHRREILVDRRVVRLMEAIDSQSITHRRKQPSISRYRSSAFEALLS